MRLRKPFISLPLLGLGIAACAAPSAYPIPAAAVAHAIFAVHPELAGSAIEMPTAIAAHALNPELAAGPIEHWAGAGALAHVRLRCAEPGACLPFYASVHLASAQPPQSPDPTDRQSAAHPESATSVRAGAHIFLLIDSGRLHLRLPATALSSGTVGSTVRVAGPARGKVLEALVVDSTTVRGTL